MRKIQVLPILVASLAMLTAPAVLPAGVFLSITLAPPSLPVYVQPPCPQDGYLWNPGYWAYGDAGYYWVPGVWVMPPSVGLLWTPPYWGFEGGFYGFHAGYWGPQVGFYGGIDYGFGYGGVGFFGGAWRGGHFAYNTAVTRVNTAIIHNTYNTRVVNNNASRASFNGQGGIAARPTAQETAAGRESHVQPTANQVSHERAASADHGQFATANHGRPATLAAVRPMTAARPAAAVRRTGQERATPAARPAARPAVANRPAVQERAAPAARPAARPAAENRPAVQERPAPAARPAAPRPAPQQREGEKEEKR